MKKIVFIAIATMFFTVSMYAQKPGIGKFTTKEKAEKVFYAAVQSTAAIKFSVKNSDKENGIIQAEMYVIGGNGKVVNLFVTIKNENEKTVIDATFTKPFGVTGKLSKFAKSYGEEIKKTITDLEIEVIEK